MRPPVEVLETVEFGERLAPSVEPGSATSELWRDVVAVRAKKLARQSALWIFLTDALLVLAFGIASPGHVFVHAANIRDLLLDGSETVLLSVGEALLLGAAQLDISVGANLVLSSAVGAEVMIHLSGSSDQVAAGNYPHEALGITLGVLTCLLTGMAFGAVNGYMVGWLKINPLLATLATMGIGTGVADVLTNGFNVPYIPLAVQTDFGAKMFFGLFPAPAVLVGLLCVVSWIAMTKTRFGVHTLALGSSLTSAVRAGLNVRRKVMSLFVIMGLFSGVAGLIDFTRFATTDVGGHTTDALSAIAGAVIGGTSIFGGNVSVGGAVIGAMLAVIVDVGLVILNFGAFYQLIAIGVVLAAAVALDQRRRAKRNAAAR